MSTLIKGNVANFGYSDKNTPRRYLMSSLAFGDLIKICQTYQYDAADCTGEQRDTIPSHVRKLKKAMDENNYTPTAVTLGLYDDHKEMCHDTPDGFSILLPPDIKLPILDGGHRIAALKLAQDDATRAQNQLKFSKIAETEVPLLILLDGDTQQDFVNLQAGRSVASAHILSMKINKKMFKPTAQQYYVIALEIAKILNTNVDSPIYKTVKFDSRGDATLPLSSIMSKSSSDLATSLYGAAKICLDAGKDAAWMAQHIIDSYNRLYNEFPRLISYGKILCPPPDGTKGGATLLIGLGMMYAFKSLITDKDLSKLTKPLSLLDKTTDGNLSGPAKRAIMGDFAAAFFKDLQPTKKQLEQLDKYPIVFYENIPVKLVELLGASSFGLNPMPKVETKQQPSPSGD